MSSTQIKQQKSIERLYRNKSSTSKKRHDEIMMQQNVISEDDLLLSTERKKGMKKENIDAFYSRLMGYENKKKVAIEKNRL